MYIYDVHVRTNAKSLDEMQNKVILLTFTEGRVQSKWLVQGLSEKSEMQ